MTLLTRITIVLAQIWAAIGEYITVETELSLSRVESEVSDLLSEVRCRPFFSNISVPESAIFLHPLKREAALPLPARAWGVVTAFHATYFPLGVERKPIIAYHYMY